ncbi:MAG: carboxylating nicotinate-nucleotide diphosphorylase [Thiohalomonadales bacterium]|nr:carboxylating nicotinate-nucleotide diphosphorylase [Thiohalomonadales bacterium]
MQLPEDYVQQQVALALAEDIGTGDVTAQLIPQNKLAKAKIISREHAILCGTLWVNHVFKQLDSEINIEWHYKDGDAIQPDLELCHIHGSARHLLSGERTALNFLQTLSATATQANEYVKAVMGTGCRILDTRKTIPGLRLAQKYAVRCGGAHNHRTGLFDMILIKENHISAAGTIQAAVEAARQLSPTIPIEVEVENLVQLQQALTARVDRILLDNMDIVTLKQAVELCAKRIPLEASGGVDLQTVRKIAETGVDYISIGSITKHIRAIDLSMRFI